MIKKMIPRDPGKSGEIPTSIEQDGNRYKLTCKKYTCLVDSVCYEYLKMRYPEARVICLGRNKPVVFFQGEVLRAVLMPLKA
jgi:hypothetical protein